MTTTIDGTIAKFYINDPDTITGDFSLKSQYSQEDISTGNSYTIVTQNDRYAEIDVTFPADFKDKHYNGYFTYIIFCIIHVSLLFCICL